MQPNRILQIADLDCSYSLVAQDKVLHIRDLAVYEGEIVFLLGASGSGKSTLLETLGLMNNTLASGKVELFKSENERYDFADLWKEDNTHQLTDIRKNFLSFIFQNTNLMENFTAYENICLSQMIKNNISQGKAIDGAVELMKQVRLPEGEVGFDTLAVNLSGGQRQRISFVRALNNDFKILLCDEPTGNLDESNAHELISIIRKNISNDKSAIIVSHDINLALKYADRIVLITKDGDKNYGEVKDGNIFKREDWTTKSELDLGVFRKQILDSFNTVKTEKQNDKTTHRNHKR